MNIGLILISFLLNAQERDDPLHLLSVNQTGFHMIKLNIMDFDIRQGKFKRKQIYHHIIVQSNMPRQAP